VENGDGKRTFFFFSKEDFEWAVESEICEKRGIETNFASLFFLLFLTSRARSRQLISIRFYL